MGVPLDDLADFGSLTLTTETRRGIAERVGLLAFFGFLTAMVSLMAYTADVPWTLDRVCGIVGLDALMLLVSVALVGLPPRGTWVVDLEGVTFLPRHRRGRSLRWAEVERVRWNRHGAAFRGAGVSITLPWNLLPGDQREPARRLIAKILGSDFDLGLPESPDPSPLTRADLPRLAARWARLVGFAVGLTAIWGLGVILLIWLAEGFRESPSLRALMAMLAMIWVLLIISVPLILDRWTDREERRTRIDPQAWRPRLTKPARSVEDWV